METLSDHWLSALESIVEATEVSFSSLTKLAMLDPKVDFRYADLKDVDFRDADLRGFDFTGADLLGAIRNSTTLIDGTTVFEGARISWVEGEDNYIVNKMLEIQSAQSSKRRRLLLAELQEQYRSAAHIRQFLITSMKKSNSIEAFFDFANAIHTISDTHINQVIREEMKRLVDQHGAGSSKGRRKLARTPYGLGLILRLLDDSINPLLQSIAREVFLTSDSPSRSDILRVVGGMPVNLI